jgi:hypothetical protein
MTISKSLFLISYIASLLLTAPALANPIRDELQANLPSFITSEYHYSTGYVFDGWKLIELPGESLISTVTTVSVREAIRTKLKYAATLERQYANLLHLGQKPLEVGLDRYSIEDIDVLAEKMKLLQQFQLKLVPVLEQAINAERTLGSSGGVSIACDATLKQLDEQISSISTYIAFEREHLSSQPTENAPSGVFKRLKTLGYKATQRIDWLDKSFNLKRKIFWVVLGYVGFSMAVYGVAKVAKEFARQELLELGHMFNLNEVEHSRLFRELARLVHPDKCKYVAELILNATKGTKYAFGTAEERCQKIFLRAKELLDRIQGIGV